METGERKYLLAVIGLVAVCATLITLVLFVALWQYRLIVGAALLIMLLLAGFSSCIVLVRGNTPPPPILKQEGMHYHEHRPPSWR